ncbi:hypothetical protein K470DRAFT_300208 [Piedraia hortae CBS 480.64]|uniref:BTB domain-containing protein n=1 Tax=Piedraia hortae CBS 480.64 TaxID=1314780 RepID=A0A6A7BXX9_9PEZI|nr:hypothetical protein K470DRAFT_300208 [Piedraia hortae CBS 480.64]
MAETPVETHTPATQKRPLEDPSSPSGPTDQPEAKRPALGKTVKEDGADDEHTVDLKADDATEAMTKIAVSEKPTSPVTQTDRSEGQRDYQSQDESAWLHVRALLSSAEAATLIGKGGENVSQIRRMSGARCTVSEYTRGAVERILTVSGPLEAVAKAFGLMIRTLNQEELDQASTPQSKTYPLRLLLPHVLIGSIIGKQGVTIREIQEASGARLNVSESCFPLSTERSLVVLGVADAVHIATYYVGKKIIEQLTERFGGAAASNYANRHGRPQGAVPGGIQVVPYVPLNGGGQIGHTELYNRKGHGMPNRGPPAPYGMPYAQPAHPQAPMPYGSPRSASISYGPKAPQQPYPQHGTPNPMPVHAGAPQQPMTGAVSGQPITQQIYIPNDMVGAIIGKGGAKINEIRQLSGSVIKINEPQDNNNERLVTVTGTPECNQMALYMLYSRLGESSSEPSRPRTCVKIPLFPRLQTPLSCIRFHCSLSNTKTSNMADIVNVYCMNALNTPSPSASSASSVSELPLERGQLQRARSRVQRSPGRLPLRSSFRSLSSCVEVIVGNGQDRNRPRTTFQIHKELLTSASPFFSAALNGNFTEGILQSVKLPEEKPEIFEWFLQWLYTGSLTVPVAGELAPALVGLADNHHTHNRSIALPPMGGGYLIHRHALQQHQQQILQQEFQTRMDGELRNNQGSPKYFLLIDLFALSDRLLTHQLSNLVLTTIARLSETTNSVPTPSDTWILYGDDCNSGIRETSRLRTLVLDLFAYKKTDKLLETHKDEWHPRFLRELVVKLKRPGPEAIERHHLEPWRPRSWSTTRACEACRETLKPDVTADRCAVCHRAYCASCLRDGMNGGAYDPSICKPWMGRGMCTRYHEHPDGDICR